MTEQIKITFSYLGNDPTICEIDWPIEVMARRVPQVGDYVSFSSDEIISKPRNSELYMRHFVVKHLHWFFTGKDRDQVFITLYTPDEHYTESIA